MVRQSVSVSVQSALILVENTEGGEEEEVRVDEDEGDLDAVQPTEDWQTLKPGNVQEGVLVLS